MSKVALVLDNNVFYPVVYGEDETPRRNLQKLVVEHIDVHGRTHFFYATPCSFLEALALTVKDWGKIEDKSLTETDDPEELVGELFDRANIHFDNVPILQVDALRERVDKYESKVQPNVTSETIFRLAIKKFTEKPDFARELRTYLVWDWVLNRLSAREDLLSWGTPLVVRVFIKVRVEGIDVCIFRLLNHHSNIIVSEMRTDERFKGIEKYEAAFRAQLDSKLRSNEDLLDAELIQSLILGIRRQRHFPMAVVTADHPERTLSRLRYAKGAYCMWVNILSKANPSLKEYSKVTCGELYAVDSSCKLLFEPLMVEDLPNWAEGEGVE